MNLYAQMEPLTSDWFRRETESEHTSVLINGFRQTHDDKQKRRLPVCCFQAMFTPSTNKKGVEGLWRENHASVLTGLVMMDVDHVEHPEQIVDRWMKRQDFHELGIVLIYITPSGEGIKVVFKARKDWGNLIDNQYEMAQLLGVTIDRGCKDAARSSFIPKADDVKFISDELFTYVDPEYDEQYGHLYRNKPARTCPTQKKWRDYEKALRKKPSDAVETVEQKTETESAKEPAELYHGVPYTKIVDALVAIVGEPKQGDRHATMMKLGNQLSVICDNDPHLLANVVKSVSFVQDIIKERGVEEVERSMQYIAEHPSYMYPSNDLKQAMRQAGVESQKDSDDPLDMLPLGDWANQIEALMPYYPCLREVCHGVPRKAWPAAVFVAAACYGTLMTRCTYHYYFQPSKERRLNYGIYVVGVPASGKSFAVRLDNLILAPLKAEAGLANAAINNYKREKNARGTSKKAQEKAALNKPSGINRYMPARTANGVFIENMQNAVEIVDGREMHLHLVTFDSELCNATNMQKGGSWIDKSAMELKAFHNEEDGQNYANSESYTGMFNVYWNYIYTGTPDALRAKINERTFGTGASTRMAAIPMPKPEFIIFKGSDDADADLRADATISQWSTRQNTRYGELPIGPLVDCCEEWTNERLAIAQYNDEDLADLMLIQRVGYYGVNISVPFIDMRHAKEFDETGTYQIDDIDCQFARLIMNIQYRCQHHYFGGLAYNYYANLNRTMIAAQSNHKSRFVDCFRTLPGEFTTEEFAKVFGLANTDSASAQIRTLVNEKSIQRVKRGHYRKLVASIA